MKMAQDEAKKQLLALKRPSLENVEHVARRRRSIATLRGELRTLKDDFLNKEDTFCPPEQSGRMKRVKVLAKSLGYSLILSVVAIVVVIIWTTQVELMTDTMTTTDGTLPRFYKPPCSAGPGT